MSTRPAFVPEVFSAREIARAAGSSTADAEALLASRVVWSADGQFADAAEAVRAVRRLRGQAAGPMGERQIFRPLRTSRQRHGGPLTVSGLLHAAAFGIVLLTTMGITGRADIQREPI